MMTCYIMFGDLDCWLTVQPLRRLLADSGVAIDWRPLLGSLGNVVSSNVRPGEDDPLAAYKARRARAREMAKVRERERNCEMLGLERHLAERRIDPSMLSSGLAWLARANAPADTVLDYLEAAFVKTFPEAADVESAPAVAELIERAGQSSDGFEDFAPGAIRSLLDERDAVLEAGILGAPAFVLDGEIFHGREHLPLVTWMLHGREGTPPV